MRYIVSFSSENMPKLLPYLIKKWGKNSALVEIPNDKVAFLKKQVEKIEPDFELEIKEYKWQLEEIPFEEKWLLVTLGSVEYLDFGHYSYELHQQKWQLHRQYSKGCAWIHGYSVDHKVSAGEMLLAVQSWCRLSQILKRPLIIVGYFVSELSYFRQFTLAENLMNEFLQLVSGKLVILEEGRGDEILQLQADNQKMLCNIRGGIYRVSLQRFRLDRLKHIENRETSERHLLKLYQDALYEQIPASQEIYVPCETVKEPEIAGCQWITLDKSFKVCYGVKNEIEKNQVQLAAIKAPQFENPILVRTPLKSRAYLTQGDKIRKIQNACRSKVFTGQGVYIGIVTEESVNYAVSDLRDKEGETRIAYYWIQETGEKGIEYDTAEINRMLEREREEESGRIDGIKEFNESTLVLLQAGGTYERQGAYGAEFLVAQIQQAPHRLQNLYGGCTTTQAVLMPDILVAVKKLVEFAEKNHKPLVLILPYHASVTHHTGRSFYERCLEQFGKREGCTLIVPTGEEGNKKHYVKQIVRGNGKIQLQVRGFTTNLVGVIQLDWAENLLLELYPPQKPPSGFLEKEKSEPFYEPIYARLDQMHTKHLAHAKIHTTGIYQDINDGKYKIYFRIENLSIGTWEIRYRSYPENKSRCLQIGIGDAIVNPYVTLYPYTVEGTMGSCGYLKNILCVSHYQKEIGKVSDASGRGECKGAENVFCAAEGIYRIREEEEKALTYWEGSVLAASKVAGVCATQYERWTTAKYLPNTLMMRQSLVSILKQNPYEQYPNEKEGYGFLETE